MCLVPEVDPRDTELRSIFLSMLNAIDRIIEPQPDGKLGDLDHDRLVASLAFLDDQLPIDQTEPRTLEEAMAPVAEPEYRSRQGRLFNLNMDEVLQGCPGLAKYEACAPDLQGRAYHLVVILDAYASRLALDLKQSAVPIEDLLILKSIIEGIQSALGV